MRTTGLIKRQEWEIRNCPVCYHKLDKVEFMKRKVLKICTCRHCGKKIVERYIVW